MTERIVLAKIADAHGIKGLVKIFPFGEDISLLESVDTIYGGDQPIKFTLKNPLGKFILAEIEGVHTRDQAEALKGLELSIDKSALPAIADEDTFYIHDLIGMRVLNTAGQDIGKVNNVENFGASDLLEILSPSGEKTLIPFTDDFVEALDHEAGTLTIAEITYL
ncbi:MAG: ribosome maturation factor RimM [Alphaproteobacteria bacterium]